MNAIFSSATRCYTRCCDAQCAIATVISKNAIITTLRRGRVDREVACAGSIINFRKNAIAHGTRCCTRCRDTQCAGAIVLRINAIFPARRGGRVDRDVACASV